MIFIPQNKEIIRDVRFPLRNKSNEIDYYLNLTAREDFSMYDCVIQKIVIMSLDEWEEFNYHLLEDRPDIFSSDDGGFTEYTDGKKYRNVTMVMARGKVRDNTIYVDNSGYLYARYVGM